MPRSGRKSRRKFWPPACFAGPSVWDSEELELCRQDGLRKKDFFLRLDGLSRRGKAAEFAGGGGMDSPAGSQDKGFVEESRKEETKMKNPVQSLPRTPISARTHTHQSVFCHVSSKLESRTQSLVELNRARDPIHTVFHTSQPVTPRPNRSADPAQSPTRPARRHDAITGLLMVSVTLTMMLFFGHLCAVLCNCVWLYLLCWIAPPLTTATVVTEIYREEEVNVNSPEYKKKVVLMGLLERNK